MSTVASLFPAPEQITASIAEHKQAIAEHHAEIRRLKSLLRLVLKGADADADEHDDDEAEA